MLFELANNVGANYDSEVGADVECCVGVAVKVYSLPDVSSLWYGDFACLPDCRLVV